MEKTGFKETCSIAGTHQFQIEVSDLVQIEILVFHTSLSNVQANSQDFERPHRYDFLELSIKIPQFANQGLFALCAIDLK